MSLLVALSAVAERPEERVTWRGDFIGGLSLESQSDPAVSVLYLGAFAGASFYFRPVIDDPAVPLALLRFIQHPGGVSVSGNATSEIFQGGVGINIYPWRDTGLLASASARERSINNVGEVNLTLGIDHYFSREVHATLTYLFDRAAPGMFADANGLAFSQIATAWASDGGSLGATFLLAQERFALIPKIDLGWVHSTYAGSSSYQTAQTADVSGVLYAASLSATSYLGRSLSLSLIAGVSGNALNASATGSTFWVPARISYVTGYGGADVSWYATESVFFGWHYQLSARATAGASTALDHFASWSVGSRL